MPPPAVVHGVVEAADQTVVRELVLQKGQETDNVAYSVQILIKRISLERTFFGSFDFFDLLSPLSDLDLFEYPELCPPPPPL